MRPTIRRTWSLSSLLHPSRPGIRPLRCAEGGCSKGERLRRPPSIWMAATGAVPSSSNRCGRRPHSWSEPEASDDSRQALLASKSRSPRNLIIVHSHFPERACDDSAPWASLLRRYEVGQPESRRAMRPILRRSRAIAARRMWSIGAKWRRCRGSGAGCPQIHSNPQTVVHNACRQVFQGDFSRARKPASTSLRKLNSTSS